MIEIGKVTKIYDDMATIGFASSPKCEGCGACNTNETEEVSIDATNDINAKLGDLVEVEISEKLALIAPYLVFGLPILLLFIGAIIGAAFSETMSVVLAISFLFISFIILIFANNYINNNKKFQSKITKILS